MLAEPPRLPHLSVVPVARSGGQADQGSGAQGYSVEKVLHHSATRLRFRVGGAAASWPKLEQALSQAAEVKHVRLNTVAGCCVVEFERSAAVDPLQWLQQLPGALPALQRLAEAPAKTRSETKPQNSEADDESFVPSRIILPVSALALALLAGPLALPPLAVAGFILNFGDEGDFPAEGWRPGNPVAFREHAYNFGMRMLGYLPDKRFAIVIGHPVFGLNFDVRIDFCLKILFERG